MPTRRFFLQQNIKSQFFEKYIFKYSTKFGNAADATVVVGRQTKQNFGWNIHRNETGSKHCSQQ